MIRRALAVLASAATVLAVAAPAAHAGGALCSVSPDPVPSGTSYTVTVTGLAPATAYAAQMDQGNYEFFFPFTTGPSGGFAQMFGWTASDPQLQPGHVRVKVSGNGTAASCTFDVTG